MIMHAMICEHGSTLLLRFASLLASGAMISVLICVVSAVAVVRRHTENHLCVESFPRNEAH